MPFNGLDVLGWSIATFVLSLLAGFYQTVFLLYIGDFRPFRETLAGSIVFWITALGILTWIQLYNHWIQAHELHAIALAAEFDPILPYTTEGSVDPPAPHHEPTLPIELVLALDDALAKAQALVAEIDLAVNNDPTKFNLL
ncbi:hypothetical protein BKA82DRAFT_4010987 [Pisolithus tinctorius]|nr:hypothetical protein BKA82DRAFT_4010987 [Pisolithus tinctorius]